MPLKFSPTVRNGWLDDFEAKVGASPKLRIYTGSQPGDTAASATGTLLAEMELPSDWLAAASGGQKAKSGTWQDLSANAGGTAGYFRIWDNPGTTCHLEGSVSDTLGSGNLKLDTTTIVSGQTINVTGFTLQAPGAP
jgi:hypothetical protein